MNLEKISTGRRYETFLVSRLLAAASDFNALSGNIGLNKRRLTALKMLYLYIYRPR